MNTSRLKRHIKVARALVFGRPSRRVSALPAITLGITIFLALAAGITGCRGLDTEQAETSARPQPTVEKIQETVSRIRGLPVKNQVLITYINRDQLQDNLKKEIEEEYPADQVQAEEKALKALGLLDRNVNLNQAVTDLLGAGVVGYYDEETKQLYVVGGSAEITPLTEITLAHEITHALQDQHFDLTSFIDEETRQNSDLELARLSLAEGDAAQVQDEYAARVLGPAGLAGDITSLERALGGLGSFPRYLEHLIAFPYLRGNDFVSLLREREDWEAVNEAFEAAPQSTEQIMHPQKYLQGEAPVQVDVADLSQIIGPSWTVADEDVVGEFFVLELLSAELNASRAQTAAAGWGGGAYRLYQSGDAIVLVMVVAWDTQKDADEFSLAMGESLEKRYESKFDTGAGVPVLPSLDGNWALVQHGNTTAVVLAPDAQISANIAGAVLGI